MKLKAQCLVAFVTAAVLALVGWMYYVVINTVILPLASGHQDDNPTHPYHYHDSRAVQFNKTIIGDGTTTGDQKSQGHVFVYSSFEEQTNGARNLWQLEMWARLMNMKVAEPFAVGSIFGIMGAAPRFNQTLQFSDYYDIEKWNQKVIKYGGSPLIEWEEFLSSAPRQAVILHTLLIPSKDPLNVTYGADDINVSPHVQISDDAMVWIKSSFNVTRVVNFTYSTLYRDPLTFKELYSYIFGDLKPSEVTLICVNWIGIGAESLNRIEIKPAPSSFKDSTNIVFNYPLNSHSVKLEISPSQQVLRAYKDYVSRYFGNRKYVGVVFSARTVSYQSPEGRSDFDKQSTHLLNCSTTLRNMIDKIRSKWGVFLAHNLGEHGSEQVVLLRDQLFLDVFNSSLKMEQREEMLIKAAGGIADKGFIAALEKTIAVHADCIILLGEGSSFVQSAASDYISLHDSKRCVVSICSEDFHDQNGTVISSHTIPDVFLNS